MEDLIPIFILTSPDVKELLADNQIDLVEVLQKEGINVSQEFAQDPTVDPKSGHKDVATVIMASAVLILAITPVLSKVIAALSHKKVVVKELVCLPVEDSSGNVVRNSSGEPILQWVERTHFLESSTEIESGKKISLKTPVGIAVSYEEAPSRFLK
ncbi:MAG: hypothetical protein F6K17_15540 [Okeania sp. SIO3C4]|nr:hypothetical protein [Okeania sp. SIO3B3]NER03928.1 hypothetical protein [Okeania sp. SIO3C4]